MTSKLTDDLLDREIRATLADLWGRPVVGMPTAEEMAGRVGSRAAARPRLALTPRLVFAVGLLLLLAVAVAAVGMQRLESRPGNGPIAIGPGLRFIDPATGAGVPVPGCAGCSVADADWSPDGSMLAYVPTERQDQLWTWTFGAPTPTLLWTCPTGGACLVRGPSWSPDGRSIVVDITRGSFGYSNVAIIDRHSGTVRTVPMRSDMQAYDPSWMPDGRILFLTGDTPAWAIMTMNEDGTDVRQVVPTVFAKPAVSPDGQWLAYLALTASDAATTYGADLGLWLIKSDGSGLQQRIWQTVDCCGVGYERPEWSPDGSRIAIVALATPDGRPTDPQEMSLVSVDPFGGSATALTTTTLTRPAWRPVP